jgi:hypothetical protein
MTLSKFKVISRVLQAGQNPEGIPLTPGFFARGHTPEMSAPDPQISRGFPDMIPKNFGDAGFTLGRALNPSNRILCLRRSTPTHSQSLLVLRALGIRDSAGGKSSKIIENRGGGGSADFGRKIADFGHFQPIFDGFPEGIFLAGS